MKRYLAVILSILYMCPSVYAVGGFDTIVRQRNWASDASAGLPISSAGMDSEFNQLVDVHNTHIAANHGGQFAHMQDFNRDSTTTTGLVWGYKAGRVRIGSAVVDISAGTFTLVDSSLNAIEIGLETPAVRRVDTSFTSNDSTIPLWFVRTASGRTNQDTDSRAWTVFSASSNLDSVNASIGYLFALQQKRDSGNANFILNDLDKDTGGTTAILRVFKPTFFRSYKYDTLIRIPQTTKVASSINTNHFISVDPDGNIILDTVGFTDSALPIREIQQGGIGVGVVQETDVRAFLQFPGNLRVHVGLDSERMRYKNLSEGKDAFWARDADSFYIAQNATTFKEIGATGGSSAGESNVRNPGIQLVRGSPTSSFSISGSGNQLVNNSGYETGVAIIFTGVMGSSSNFT